jgi:hypothetical protein
MYKIKFPVKIRCILSFLLLAPLCLYSQEDSASYEKTFSVGAVPQYAIVNGTRLDFDVRLKKENQWLVIAPQFYNYKGNSNIWDYEELSGFGIDLNHRIYRKGKTLPTGAYFSYGPVFQYFSVKDNGLASYVYKEEGIEYVGLNEELIHTNIFKFGGNVMFGVQSMIGDIFYIDTYIGTGIRFSYDNRTSGLHGYFNDWWGDLGYSGSLIVAGVRFGILL